jgi:hypothetical protein
MAAESTDYPLGELRRGQVWCLASAPFPHTTIIIIMVARSMVKTIHLPSVQHKNANAEVSIFITDAQLFFEQMEITYTGKTVVK